MANLQSDDYKQVQKLTDLTKEIVLSGEWYPMEGPLKPFMMPQSVPFNSTTLNMSTMPLTKARDAQTIFTSQTAGMILKEWDISNTFMTLHQGFYSNTGSHLYRTFCITVEIQILGSPRANGIILLTYSPDYNPNVVDDIISNYSLEDVPNCLHSKFLPIHENSTTKVILPITPPFRHLNNNNWGSYTPFKQWRAGYLSCRMFTDVGIEDTASVKPSITFYTSMDAVFGAPEYENQQEV